MTVAQVTRHSSKSESCSHYGHRALSLPCLLHLLNLVAEGTGCILKVLLLDGGEGAEHDQLEEEVGEADKNDEVVQARLHFAHLG